LVRVIQSTRTSMFLWDRDEWINRHFKPKLKGCIYLQISFRNLPLGVNANRRL